MVRCNFTVFSVVGFLLASSSSVTVFATEGRYKSSALFYLFFCNGLDRVMVLLEARVKLLFLARETRV